MGRGGSGAFFLGLALFVIGVGATVFTYMSAAPGGTYVVFGGLIIGGLIRMVTALIGGGFGASAFATRSNKKMLGQQKAAWYEDPSAQYVEKLADMPSGYCWQCGMKLRRGRTICMSCGAAQNSAAPQRDSSATPGGMTFGPPPKLAKSPHPYDVESEPQPPAASPARGYFPTDPDGSYGWGPAYAPNDGRGSRSNPGYQPGGQPQRSGPGDARRYVAPPPEREAPRADRSYGSSSRHSGDLPPVRHSGDLPPVRHSGDLPPVRHSGDLPPVGRRHSGPLVDDEPPGRRAGRSDDERRQPPRGRRHADDGWDDDEDERRYDQRRASSPRHAARPRPRPPYDRDAGGWDDDDRGPPASGRHPSRR